MSKKDLKSDEITMLLEHITNIVGLMNQEIEEIDTKITAMQKRIEALNNG